MDTSELPEMLTRAPSPAKIKYRRRNSEMQGYVELHARSGFSFLEGASIPEELVGMAASFDMPAMAIVDRNGIYGAPRFHMAAKKAGIRAHIGSEITCTNGVT